MPITNEPTSYHGRRNVEEGTAAVVIATANRELAELPPRLELRNHSPEGFNWGYGGSGPAQLALAVLADALGNDAIALRYYQMFKFSVIARLERSQWSLTRAQVWEWFIDHLAQELNLGDMPRDRRQ